MKRIVFRSILIFLTATACIGVAELVSAVGLKVLSHDSKVDGNGDMIASWERGFRRAPLFSYVKRDGNNYGFEDELDFPLSKGKDDFIIGILGGSVADSFANQVKSSSNFIDALKQSIPELRNKNIRLVNLACPGYKQPQQFVVFSAFMDFLDAIVQVDGWNEVWIRSEMPAFSEVFYNNRAGTEWSLGGLSLATSFLEGFEQFTNASSLFAASRTTRFLDLVGHRLIDRRATGIMKSRKGPLSIPETGDRPIATWTKYAKLEMELAHGAGIRAFFFLQPSRYLAGSKSLSKSEIRIGDAQGFKETEAQFERLRARAANELHGRVIDLADVFAHEGHEVYIDNCCHVNDRGNEIMADRIAADIARKWGAGR